MYPLLTKKTQRYRKESARETVRETPQVESGSYDDNSAPERISDEISSDIKKPRAESEIKTENDAPKNATASSVSSVSYVGKAKRSNRRYFKGGSVFYRRKQKVNGANGKNGVFRLSHVSTASFTDLMKRPRSSSSSNTTEEVKKPKRSKTQQGRRIIRFMRKAFFLTLLCVVSDVVIAIIQMVVVVPEVVYLVLFDINLLINVICIVMSFRDWPHMIAPLCAKYLLPPKSPSHNSANNARSTKTVVTKAGNNLPRINALKPQGTSSCSESNG
uniref:Uncharacterized protein n=1 Tax=Ciona savignyi TaxID=51511 RepID=H2YS34_CIOSA